jgi:endonuclease YncB( thermonuclease family)
MRLTAALVLAFLAVPATAETITGNARVVDGDTIEVRHTRVRLSGIDAPELHQQCRRSSGTIARLYPCGRDAKAALRHIIGVAAVSRQGKDRDRYGRTVATCTAAGRDVGREMVREGWAVA